VELADPTLDQRIRNAWQGGEVWYLLHDGQLELRDWWHSLEARLGVINCSRRYGKSLLCCELAIEQAIKTPESQIRYATPTAKMARSIVEPHMRWLLRDCPDDLRPAYSRQEGTWTFRNGSQIHVAGCDAGGAERLRGVSTHLGLVDEAGFVDELQYVVDDILRPQTLTVDGRLLLVSTPPRSPAHPFRDYALSAMQKGTYAHRSIFDAPHIPREKALEYIGEVGGLDSTTAQREYMAEFVTDESIAVVPEFQRMASVIVRPWKRPPYYFPYVVADFGYVDLTAVLFGYYDFRASMDVVEDELIFERSNSAVIVPAIRAKEHELWGDAVVRRYADVPEQMRADLAAIHEMSFSPVIKAAGEVTGIRPKHAMVNRLRVRVGEGHMAIHPRCETLIAHAKYGVWNTAKTSFERSGEHGHFDALDALVYFSAALNRDEYPYPLLARGGVINGWMTPAPKQTAKDSALVKSAMGGR
jgi:hypothetical protein